jgi:hypothetical protein
LVHLVTSKSFISPLQIVLAAFVAVASAVYAPVQPIYGAASYGAAAYHAPGYHAPLAAGKNSQELFLVS